MKELRSLPKEILKDDEFVLKVRDNFNQLCELSLDTLNSEQIINILQRGLVDANSGFDVGLLSQTTPRRKGIEL